VYGIVALLAVTTVAQFWLHFATAGVTYDALSYYTVGRLLLTGQGAFLYDLPHQHALSLALSGGQGSEGNWPFVYPPWVALVSALVATLPYTLAYSLFVALQALALGGAAFQLARLLPLGDWKFPLLALATSASVVVVLVQPQWSAWPLWGLSGAFVALYTGHPRRVGPWLLLGLVKPSLLVPVLLWLVVTRQWRALVVLTSGGAVLSLVSAVVLGPWWEPWLQAVALQDGSVAYPYAMPTLRGALTLVSLNPGVLGIELLGSGVAVLALWYASPVARPLGALLAGWLLIPHAYLYDLVLLIPPALVAWRFMPSARPLLRFAPALTWLGVVLPHAIFGWGLILLFILSVVVLSFKHVPRPVAPAELYPLLRSS